VPSLETKNPLGGFAAAVRWKILDGDSLNCASDAEAEVDPAERDRRFDLAARLVCRNYQISLLEARVYLDGHCGSIFGHQVGNLMLQGDDFDTALTVALAAGLPLLRLRTGRAGLPLDTRVAA